MTRDELVMALAQASRMGSTYTVLYHHAIADRLGLNPSDHKCLDMVLIHGPLTAGELAEKTGLTTGAITGVIDRLEAAGYARREKDPNDRRRVIVTKVRDSRREKETMRLFMPLIEGTGKLAADYTNAELEFILEFLNRSLEIMQEALPKLRDIAPIGESATGKGAKAARAAKPAQASPARKAAGVKGRDAKETVEKGSTGTKGRKGTTRK